MHIISRESTQSSNLMKWLVITDMYWNRYAFNRFSDIHLYRHNIQYVIHKTYGDTWICIIWYVETAYVLPSTVYNTKYVIFRFTRFYIDVGTTEVPVLETPQNCSTYNAYNNDTSRCSRGPFVGHRAHRGNWNVSYWCSKYFPMQQPALSVKACVEGPQTHSSSSSNKALYQRSLTRYGLGCAWHTNKW